MKSAVCLAVALLAGLISGWLVPEADELVVCDVGQGDAAVLRHGGVNLLIDDGPAPKKTVVSSAPVVAALRRSGVDHLDLVLLSHPDLDHVGGTLALLGLFPDMKIAVSKEFMSQPKLRSEIAQWGVRSEAILWLPSRCRIKIDDCVLNIECPQLPKLDSNDNLGSMFVRIDDHGATADFSGDAPSSVEEAEIPTEVWTADLLHVGHHGSRTSTGDRWISAVHPAVAVVSCGLNNPFGHPNKATLDRLRAHGVPVARTDLEGDLVFKVVGGHFRRS